jgi:probable F420-dependent oxidoreductase
VFGASPSRSASARTVGSLAPGTREPRWTRSAIAAKSCSDNGTGDCASSLILTAVIFPRGAKGRVTCSPMTVSVGIGLFTAQLPANSKRSFEQEYRETLELVRLAERVGFDSAWVSEHHGSSDGYLPSLLPMLAAFAAVTERIELGTGVILTPLHDPLRLAEDAAVVDQLSGGRLLLGIGNGWREEEFRMFEAARAERGARTQETIEVLRRAWTGRRFSFEGRMLRYDRVRITPQPARPGGPPILLGGYDRKAVIRAGRLADGYITDETGPDEVRGNLELVAQGANDVGRDPRALSIVLLQNAFAWRDGDPWPLIRQGVVQQLGTYEAWGNDADTPEHDRLEPAVPTEEDLRLSTPAGPPDEVARALLATIRAAGDRDVHLVVRLHYPGMDLETASRATELFAAAVMPALKAG